MYLSVMCIYFAFVSMRLKGGSRQYFRLLICICCGCNIMCARCIDFVFVSTLFRLELFPQCSIYCFHFMIIYNLTYVISAYHHSRGEFESRSGELYSYYTASCTYCDVWSDSLLFLMFR